MGRDGLAVAALLAAALAGCGFTGRSSPIDGSAGGDGPASTDGPAGVIDGPPGSADAPPDGAPPVADARTTFLIEAEDYDSLTMSAADHHWLMRTDVPGYSAASFMRLLPANGGACVDPTQLGTCAASLHYNVSIAAGASYYVHVRVLAMQNDEDSLWVGVDGSPDPTAIDFNGDGTWRWETRGGFALGPGAHTIDLWQREAGVRVDVLAVSTLSTPPP